MSVSAPADLAIPPDAMLLPVFAEHAKLLRDELQGLASAQLEEMVQPLRVVTESLQGLLGQLGSVLERVVVALEGLSLATDVVRTSSTPLSLAATPPSLVEINVGLAGSGALEVLRCFSPRDISTPLVASEKDVPVVQAMAILQQLVAEPDGLSTLEELKVFGVTCTDKSSKELIQMDADEPLERASLSSWGEFLEDLALSVSRSPQSMQMGEVLQNLIP
jgi:hypothetical protein